MHRPTADLPEHLRTLHRHFPFERSLAQDPLALVRPFARDPAQAELAGLFASVLAIGNTTAIQGAFRRFERAIGGDFVRFVQAPNPALRRSLAGFRHRWIRGDQLCYLADRLRSALAETGTVQELFRAGLEDGGFDHGLDALSRSLKDGAGPARGPPGYAALFPSPLVGSHSPCKRLTLYVRWMARRGFPDLGLWRSVSPAVLRVPLDLHVHWIAYHLGLTRRKSRNWATVEEVTAALRAIDPRDPIKFDFVLCHTGISGDCPKERNLSICGPCVVRPDCLMWRRRGSAS